MNPKISVIIPCFNHGKFIEDAVESVKKQTFKEYEIIVVNDGSTDQFTVNKIKYLSDKYKDIVVINQPNGHLSNARNNGIKISKGEFFFPLDADDYIEPGTLEMCYKKIQNNKKLGFVYTYTRFFGDINESIVRRNYNLCKLMKTNYIVASCLFRKKAWDSVGGYDESMKSGYEDWEFLIRLGKSGWFGKLLRYPLFCYRIHGESMVGEAIKKHNKNIIYIKNKHSDIYFFNKKIRIKCFFVSIKDFFVSVPIFKDSIKFKIDASGFLEYDNWKKYPVRTFFKIVPIGVKKRINRMCKKDVLDVSYYGKKIKK